jgi:hypothetical protein
LRKFREFAERLGLEFWFSASLRGEDPLFDGRGVPFLLAPFLEDVSVLITLSDEGEHVRLLLVKDRDYPVEELKLKLDPRTLLLAETCARPAPPRVDGGEMAVLSSRRKAGTPE